VSLAITYRKAAALLIMGGLLVLGPPSSARAQTKADNTKVNQRDRQVSQVTADQQPNNRSDLEITQQIRRAIVADKSLSTYARNIKIITKGGKVTLKGPVHTADEQKAIEAEAAEIAGAGNVTNEISITNQAARTPHHTSKATKKAGA
jgi:hyperosmotically inducible periplasmic protein